MSGVRRRVSMHKRVQGKLADRISSAISQSEVERRQSGGARYLRRCGLGLLARRHLPRMVPRDRCRRASTCGQRPPGYTRANDRDLVIDP